MRCTILHQQMHRKDPANRERWVALADSPQPTILGTRCVAVFHEVVLLLTITVTIIPFSLAFWLQTITNKINIENWKLKLRITIMFGSFNQLKLKWKWWILPLFI